MRNIAQYVKKLFAVASLSAVLISFASVVRAEFKYEPLTAYIPFSCVKAETGGRSSYDIVAELIDGSHITPEDSVITIEGSGSGSFGIEIDEPGTYQYKIYERSGNNSKIIYDDTVYTVTIFVTHGESDELVYRLILSDGGLLKPSEIKFVNEAIRSDEQYALVATGETASVFIPYAIAMFLIGGIVLFLALRRRKEDTYE